MCGLQEAVLDKQSTLHAAIDRSQSVAANIEGLNIQLPDLEIKYLKCTPSKYT